MFRHVDVSDLPADIERVEFDTVTGVVRFTSGTLQTIGRSAFRPFEKYVARWKAAGMPERTLAEAKVNARAQINSRRDTLEAAGFQYLGKTFDSDPRSAQRITIAAQTAQLALATGQPFSIGWTAQDNTVVTLDGQQMLGMPVALAQYAAGLHEHAKAKKAEIIAATTIEEVEAIQW